MNSIIVLDSVSGQAKTIKAEIKAVRSNIAPDKFKSLFDIYDAGLITKGQMGNLFGLTIVESAKEDFPQGICDII